MQIQQVRSARKRLIITAAVILVAMPLVAGTPPVIPPQVDQPFAGDARLEPLPGTPIHLANVTVFGRGKKLLMRFPPRVNGQVQSDGDKHADLFVFVSAATGLPIEGQLPVIEAVPLNTVPSLGEFTARLFSPIWEMHVVTVTPDYVANEIDSSTAVLLSSKVVQIFQTNVFLNCPVVPLGTTLDPGTRPIEEVWFNGQLVALVPYDIEDGGFNPQVLFKFEDSSGRTLPSANSPHLVASRLPGDAFYSSIWEVWTVTVPDGFDPTTLISTAAIEATGFPISTSNIRLNCPVVSIETAPGSGVFDPFPFEDAFLMMLNDCSGGQCRFNPRTFKTDLREGTTLQIATDAAGNAIGRSIVPSPFFVARTFLITETVSRDGNFAGGFEHPLDEALANDGPGNSLKFPNVADEEKGNVVPVILAAPFPVVDPLFPPSSGPNTTGKLIRFSQEELDRAFLDNLSPRLPEAIEENIAALIAAGVLDASWAPGEKPYQKRLALVGRALFEFVWGPDHGAQPRDTTSCVACHSQPSHGGSGRGLYTVRVPATGLRKSPPPFWGSGGRQLQRFLVGSDGSDANTHAFGLQGDTATIRAFIQGAARNHFGVRAPGIIVEEALGGDPNALACDTGGDGVVSIVEATVCDPDADGVINELTEGQLTAMVFYGLSLPVPDQAVTDEALETLGVSRAAVDRGKLLFRGSLAGGGIGCADCHTVFLPLATTELTISNPATENTFELQISHHFANQSEVDAGDATNVGQPGIRAYTDFKRHEMGPMMQNNGTSRALTQPLWDVGSDFPYLRGGTLGSNLREVILAHGGEAEGQTAAFEALDDSAQQDVVDFLSAQLIEGKIGEGSGGEPAAPDFAFPPTPVCEKLFAVEALSTLTIPVTAVAAGGFVTLSVEGLPLGATLSSMMPLRGDKLASTVFSWTPELSRIGTTATMVFRATVEGTALPVAECLYTITVVEASDLLVQLQSFDVAPADRQVRVEWETAREFDNLGFYVWRKDLLSDTEMRVSGFVPAVALNNSGGRYAFVDESAVNGVEYQYWLEDVDLDGRRTDHPGRRAVPNPRQPSIRLKAPLYGSRPTTRPLELRFEQATDRAWVLIGTDPTFGESTRTLRLPAAPNGSVRISPDFTLRLHALAAAKGGVVYWRVQRVRSKSSESATWRMQIGPAPARELNTPAARGTVARAR